ncbi:MAG: hypothetical protein GY870_17105, partial [archaeon]|nr:hypothetical protein [archaeon]
PLNKTNLIDEENISKGKKISLEYVFLTRDVAVIRIPNVDIFKAAKAGQMPIDIREKYIEEVEKFFQTYRISSEDASILGEIVSNPDSYEIIQVLRNEYCIREELPQKVGREIEGIENILKDLAEKKIITAIKDKKQRIWVLLLSDIKFPTFFPEYMIDIIRRRWKEGTIAKEIALKHLEILRAEYIATQAPKYRRKVLKNIIDNFEKAEELIAKEEFDQAATLVDTMASYARDMGERNFGELLAGIGKFIREDKERYIEDKFPADREKVLEYLSILSEKSEEKEVKKKKTPKEVKIKKEEKKKIHSGASQLGKIDGIQTEKAEKERKKKATQDLYKEPEVLNKESEILDDNLLNMSMEDFQKGEVSDSDTTKTEITSDSNDSKKIELQKLIDKANEENDYSLLAQYEGQFSELEKSLGNTKSAEHHKEKQNYYVIQALNMLRTDLEKDGKKAKKNGDFIKAAELFTQCKDISEKLFQSGKMSESESVNKFTNLIEEMNSKSS